MPRFALLTVVLRRIGGHGAIENVTEVLAARADANAAVASLAARMATAEGARAA